MARMISPVEGSTAAVQNDKTAYNRFLLLVAGLGGLLYGIDVGIIAGALPYLEATSGLNAGQLSIVVAAVLLGSVISTLFAGLLADWMGRRSLMALSGVMFVISIPMIALAHGYGPLVFGRLLQGVSAGLIGVVVPLYLAECLTASNRGKGTGIFQWLLTLGIVTAAVVGVFFSFRVDQVAKLGDAARLLAFKDTAWRGIFWVSLPPGILFVIGSFMVAESPRLLLRRGKKDAAYAALLRSRTTAQADLELKEMQDVSAAEKGKSADGTKAESLLRRKYVIPFVLACIILACNQATGINSIIAYNTNILLQSGLSDVAAHWCTLSRNRTPTRGHEERSPIHGQSRPETCIALQRRTCRQASPCNRQRQHGRNQAPNLSGGDLLVRRFQSGESGGAVRRSCCKTDRGHP